MKEDARHIIHCVQFNGIDSTITERTKTGQGDPGLYPE